MINSTEYIRLMSFLKRFDCNNREASTYIECLQIGTCSVQEIAKRLNSNRITTHSTIQQLIKKGLLFETRKGKKRLIAAESPDVLYRILQRKINEVKLIEKELDSISKLLHFFQSQGHDLFNVRLYESENDFKKILEETIDAQNNLCVLISGEFFSDSMNFSYLHDYYKRLAENNVYSRIISSSNYVNAFKEYQVKYKLQIRHSSSLNLCKVGCYMWNDNIALTSFKDDRIVCTIIQNPELVFFFRNFIFESLWKTAEIVV